MPRQVKDVNGCDGCPLRQLYPDNNFVEVTQGSGLRLCVSEAPGEIESLLGKPLVGGAGKWFDSLLRRANIRRETLTILNTIQCRPPENIYPTDAKARFYISKEDGEKAVKQCIRNHVLPVILSRPWERIDLLGEKALRWIAGKTEGIHMWRGSILEVDTDEIEKRVSA